MANSDQEREAMVERQRVRDEKASSKRKYYEEKENRREERDGNSEHKQEERHRKRRHRDSSRDRDRKRERRTDENDERKRDERLKDAVEGKKENREEVGGKQDEKEAGGGEDEKTTNASKKDSLLTRAGGAYIPPAKLRMLQQQIEDKSSAEYQRISWEALKKSINGLINKVNISNLGNIVRELFQENIVRGRGLLAQAIIKAQSSSPTFTHVYSAMTSVINTKFPKIGELILRRLILLFRRSYKRNNKAICLSASRFIAHLVNQEVAHEILALEILTLLLQTPTDDSVELTIAFLKECGMKLTDVSPRGLNAVFDRLRSILHNSEIEKRVQYMVEVMFAVRKDKFKDHPAVLPELDVVDESDQITHLLRLDEAGKTEDILNIFKFDPDYLANEDKYHQIKKGLLGEDDSDDSSGDDDEDDDDSDDEGSDGNEEGETEKMDILDQTETNMVALRRTVYLTIQSSLNYEECAHKMMKMQIQPNQMGEVCNMVIDCCAQQRSYEKFYGLLGQRFCQVKKEYIDEFVRLFTDQYNTIHRLETNKLRNVAKFFAHLLYTDAIPWTVLADINLNEEDTTSSSRIFIKILFQELAEFMGLPKLNERLKDPTLSMYFEGLFPRDNPRNTRFAINFFTAVGLGGLTDDLREHLKNAPKKIMSQAQDVGSSDSSSDSSDSDSSSDNSDSSSSEDSSPEEDNRNKRSNRGGDGKPPPQGRNIKGRGADEGGDEGPPQRYTRGGGRDDGESPPQRYTRNESTPPRKTGGRGHGGDESPPGRYIKDGGRGGGESPPQRYTGGGGRGGGESPPQRYTGGGGRGGGESPPQRYTGGGGRGGGESPPQRYTGGSGRGGGESPPQRYTGGGGRGGGESPPQRYTGGGGRGGSESPPQRYTGGGGRGGGESPRQRYTGGGGRGGGESPPQRYTRSGGRGGSESPPQRYTRGGGRRGSESPPQRYTRRTRTKQEEMSPKETYSRRARK